MLEPSTSHHNGNYSVFAKFTLVLFALVVVYAVLIACLSIPWLQRFALYAHKIRTPLWWHNLYKPESFGFAKNQVVPFKLKSSDEVTLFVWHVLPLRLYEEHEAALREQQPGVVDDITNTVGFKLLRSDPESRLILNFHGNAGHVAQGWRTDTYRVLTSNPSNSHIHLLALDYRGFGVSSGTPTERGVISDGVALVDWAMHVAKIPPERIVILGQSLGTAVATGVTHHFATNPRGPVPDGLDRWENPEGGVDEDIEESRREAIIFAGVILVASFKYLPALLLSYRIAGFLPILGPIRPFRFMHSLIEKLVVDKWNSARRLQSYQRAARETKSSLTLIHAINDGDIPWTHSVDLFCGIVGAETERGGISEDRGGAQKRYEIIAEVKRKNSPGSFEWTEKDGREARLEIMEYGGHNRIVTYSCISLAIIRAFQKSGAKPSISLI